MKTWRVVGILAAWIMAACAAAWAQKGGAPVSSPSFEVAFEQGGQRFSVANHHVTLKKRTFSIVVLFKQPDDILVNVSATPESFDKAQSGAALDAIPGFRQLGMAEETFNPKTLLMLSTSAPHYWYYQNESDHRFNDARTENGRLVCRRIVAQLLSERRDQLVTVKDFPGKALYFVFMKTGWTEDFRQQFEYQREYVKVTFK